MRVPQCALGSPLNFYFYFYFFLILIFLFLSFSFFFSSFSNTCASSCACEDSFTLHHTFMSCTMNSCNPPSQESRRRRSKSLYSIYRTFYNRIIYSKNKMFDYLRMEFFKCITLKDFIFKRSFMRLNISAFWFLA